MIRLFAAIGATVVSVFAAFVALLWLASRDLAEPDDYAYIPTGI